MIDQDKKEYGETEEDIFYRWEWFWRNRVDKYGGFSKYGEQLNSILQRAGQNNLKSGSSINWTAIGPSSTPTECTPYGRNHSGVAQVRSVWANSSNIYLGCQGGGFWQWSGSTWINKTDAIPCFTVFDIDVDNSGKIYLATGFKQQSGSILTNDGYGYGIIYCISPQNSWTD